MIFIPEWGKQFLVREGRQDLLLQPDFDQASGSPRYRHGPRGHSKCGLVRHGPSVRPSVTPDTSQGKGKKAQVALGWLHGSYTEMHTAHLEQLHGQ